MPHYVVRYFLGEIFTNMYFFLRKKCIVASMTVLTANCYSTSLENLEFYSDLKEELANLLNLGFNYWNTILLS